MAKTLELLFKNSEGKTARFTIPAPIEPVDPTAVGNVMDLIIARNIFAGDLVEKMGARLVDHNVSEISLP